MGNPETYRIPQQFIILCKDLFMNSSCCVKMEGGTTNYFETDTGMRQRCILSPFLSLLAMDFTIKKARDDQNCGIRWKGGACLTDFNFADDITLLANTRADLQSTARNLKREAGKIGLRLNSKKMKVIIIKEVTTFPPINIGHQTTEEIKCFIYLGSIVDNNGKQEADINSRIGKASLMCQCQQLVSALRSTCTIPSSLLLPLMPAKIENDIGNHKKAQNISAELFTKDTGCQKP